MKLMYDSKKWVSLAVLFAFIALTLPLSVSGANVPPVADAEPGYQSFNVGEIAWFSGNMSYDPDGFIVSYFWNFGDGEFSNDTTTFHEYSAAGYYLVDLLVYDDQGGMDNETVIVEVFEPEPENLPPVAYIFPDYPVEVNVHEEAYLNATLSYDVDGTIVSYDWDFGDGYLDTGMFVSHSYNMTGNYTVSLTITDDDGATDIDTNIITVRETEPPNEFPVAYIFPDYPLEVNVNDEVYLNGTLSYDVDGTIVSFEWDFGDGCFDTGIFTSHSYALTGNYTVTLTVTDDDGATDSDSNIVIVTETEPDNLPPVAYIFPDYPVEVNVYEEAYLNATLSYDVDGTIESFDWDFGDGCFDTGMFVSHSYNMTGNYTVTLIITDDDGATDIDTNVVMVIGNASKPNMIISKSAPETASPDEAITYTISYQNIGTDWAYNVAITEIYPPEVAFVAAIPAPDIGTNTWTIGTVSPGGLGTIEIIVQIDVGASGSNITNLIELAYEDAIANPYGPIYDTATTFILNQLPVAAFTYLPNNPHVHHIISFDASASYDPNGSIVSYEWDFGDNTTGSGITINHVYDVAGEYQVTLTVMDNGGAQDQIIMMVEVSGYGCPVNHPIFQC